MHLIGVVGSDFFCIWAPKGKKLGGGPQNNTRGGPKTSKWLRFFLVLAWGPKNRTTTKIYTPDHPPYGGQNICMCLLHVLEHSKHF